MKDLRTPLGRVRGLGSAKQGLHHWWWQRVTAIALVPLSLWFILSLASMRDSSYANMVIWLQDPLNSALLLGILFAAYKHAYLGLQVVIEDYISNKAKRLASLLIIKFLCLLCALCCVVAIVKINFLWLRA
ncbi:MAG: succinate dehydrogenase, hydrophobic membrane anchor protein [Candidatus Eutrophobiaceae bacterium]